MSTDEQPRGGFESLGDVALDLTPASSPSSRLLLFSDRAVRFWWRVIRRRAQSPGTGNEGSGPRGISSLFFFIALPDIRTRWQGAFVGIKPGHAVFHARGTGSAAAAAGYLTRETDSQGEERADVSVLRGDPDQVAAVADVLEFEQKYTSGVSAWAPEDQPSDAQVDLPSVFLDKIQTNGRNGRRVYLETR